MNRDQTIELFERCEAARSEAKKAALAEGKSDDARDIAHEAAKAIWNGEWAEPLLAERKKLEEEERWSAKKDYGNILEGQNEETRKWLSDAAADFTRCHFLKKRDDGGKVTAGEVKKESAPEEQPVKPIYLEEDRADFSGFLFPGPARFGSATFTGDARFGSATFTGDARFGSATFTGPAWFGSATFTGPAWFGSATFTGDAWFDSATFTGPASFNSATFTGLASFESATFRGAASFNSATFTGPASFESATFRGPTLFDSATYSRDANFRGTRFSSTARFEGAQFFGFARFNQAQCSGNMIFNKTLFRYSAKFSLTKFDQFASFEAARFLGTADFSAIRGERAFSMAEARFEHVPDFIQAHFEEAPRLDNVMVVARMAVPYVAPAEEVTTPPPEGATGLRRLAWTCKRIGQKGWRGCHPAWTYPRRWSSGALQRVFHADSDIPARWRALKRLAIQAHDQDREHEFFAGEIRSARFAGDWPLPWPVWKTNAWLGFFRFWFGIFYGLTSNYGRSVAQPALWWLGALAVAGMFNLGEHRGMAGNRVMAEFWGASWPSAYVTTSYEAWRWDRPCYVTQAQLGARREPSVEGSAQGGSDAPDLKQEVDALKREIARLKMRNGRPDIEVVGLSDKVRADTNVPFEALQLALRDGFLILYGDADTAHRIYGCLYGVELYGGGTPVAVVPAQVATASAIHKIFSAIMIFLFGLALRNMLKMK